MRAGDDIDTYCSKCRMDLAHVIIACDGVKIVRVQCKTCNGTHAYKHTPASEARPRKRPATGRATGKSRSKPSAFETAMEGRDAGQAQAYRPQVAFIEGDVLEHPSFGLGVVTRVLADAKVQVAFVTAEKVLVHARA